MAAFSPGSFGLVNAGLVGRRMTPWCDAARVDLPPRHPPVVVTAGPEGPAVEANLQDGVGVDVVGDLQGVGVEKHLVGVEAVAALVDVGDEADGAAGHQTGSQDQFGPQARKP